MTWAWFVLGFTAGGFTTTWALAFARLFAVVNAKAKAVER